ncbi:hypothetical protein CRG98_014832 [Punica granatum]|uniref:Uncharacterized protein n=1 Tax=Punica granatum TaxID=22663 RepID=A0A2I0K9J7_PUNGR|nr:hypothetical protein CRG98_014832 [Punica granatum]
MVSCESMGTNRLNWSSGRASNLSARDPLPCPVWAALDLGHVGLGFFFPRPDLPLSGSFGLGMPRWCPQVDLSSVSPCNLSNPPLPPPNSLYSVLALAKNTVDSGVDSRARVTDLCHSSFTTILYTLFKFGIGSMSRIVEPIVLNSEGEALLWGGGWRRPMGTVEVKGATLLGEGRMIRGAKEVMKPEERKLVIILDGILRAQINECDLIRYVH